jgi:hypothetical protein
MKRQRTKDVTMDCNFHLQAATNSQVKVGFNNKQEMLQAMQYVLCT